MRKDRRGRRHGCAFVEPGSGRMYSNPKLTRLHDVATGVPLAHGSAQARSSVWRRSPLRDTGRSLGFFVAIANR